MTMHVLAQFGSAALLGVVAAAIAAGAISISILRWRARQVARLQDRGGGQLLSGIDPARALWKFGLITAVVLLLAIAGARPQFGERTRTVTQQGIALVVALDVSLSMAAEDAKPNRMRLAQRELAALLDRISGDRVGLVIFAGDALVRFPLTRDLDTADEIIQLMLPGQRLLPPGTDVAAAIDASQALLEESEARTNVILLIGDGESLTGEALTAAASAAAAGTRVFTAGVGSAAGSTIPVQNRTTLQVVPKIDAETGDPVITRLDAVALESLAAIGNGRYIPLDRPGVMSDLAGDLAALDASRFDLTTERRPIERFQIPLLIALALLLVEPLIAARPAGGAPRGRLLPSRRLFFAGLLPLIAIIAAACSDFAAERNADGNRAYAEERYDDAVTAYQEALGESPDDGRIALNLGRALHALTEYDAAAAATGRAIVSADTELSARAFFHLGNHRFEQENLLAARSAYIESLLLNPSDTDAKINLEIVNAAIAVPALPGDLTPLNPAEDSPGSQDGGKGGAPRGASDAEGSPGEAGEAADAAGDATPPVDTAPGQPAGRAPVPEDDVESGPTRAEAAAALEAALEEFDRDNPTAKEALAILDALRALDENDPRRSRILGVEIAGIDDY